MNTKKLLFGSAFVAILSFFIWIMFFKSKPLTSFYIKHKAVDPTKPDDCLTITTKNGDAIFGKCVPENDLWTAFQNGQLKHLKTGLCFELKKKLVGNELVGNTCDLNNPLQQFNIDGAGRFRPTTNQQICLDPKDGWTDCTKPTSAGWYFNSTVF